LILGPDGVGKTTVAQRVLGEDVVAIQGNNLHQECVRAVRRQRWPEELLSAPTLVIDGPTLLHRRPGATRLLAGLIRDRTEGGYRTAVCQGAGDDSATLLVDAVEPSQRATLTLRFPVGRGRQRFAMRMCQQLDIDRTVARRVEVADPWTYTRVIAALEAAAKQDPEAPH